MKASAAALACRASVAHDNSLTAGLLGMHELESKFKALMASLNDVEDIDKLELPARFNDARRADYFVSDRRVILELKSLYADPSGKIDETLAERRNDPDFPQFYGQADLQAVLRKLPDGAELGTRIHDRVTRSIEDAIRSAKKQLASTRRVFQQAASDGVVVLLNSDLEILYPNLIGQKCQQLVDSIRATEERINVVWLIQSTHARKPTASLTVIPSFFAESQRFPPTETTRNRLHRLAEERARFDGAHFLGNEPASSINLLKSVSELAASSATEKKRYVWWQDEYRSSPYLRGLSDDALLEHTARIVLAASDFFVAQPSARTPLRDVNTESAAITDLMRGFTHCQQEISARVLDLRLLGAKLNDLAKSGAAKQ